MFPEKISFQKSPTIRSLACTPSTNGRRLSDGRADLDGHSNATVVQSSDSFYVFGRGQAGALDDRQLKEAGNRSCDKRNSQSFRRCAFQTSPFAVPSRRVYHRLHTPARADISSYIRELPKQVLLILRVFSMQEQKPGVVSARDANSNSTLRYHLTSTRVSLGRSVPHM